MSNNTLGWTTPEFKEKVKSKLDAWFGGAEKYETLFQWFDEEMAYVCVRSDPRLVGDCDLYFFRLFMLAGTLVLSEDRKMEI
jgi:hypothetical protein